MSRSCGIRIGPRRFELVVLDGSPKRHRIVAYQTGDFPVGGEDPTADAVGVLKAAAKASSVPSDNVAIAIDTGLAAFRTIKMPDLDETKIEQVLKFEVEGELPQWNIDDVVVDFLKLETASGETSLLVSAVPKSEIAREIAVCSRAGIEPLEVELEATAMVNAALAAEVCSPEDAQVLVHIGEVSTAVVTVDGGRIRALRAIHIGALSHEPGAPEPVEPVEGQPAPEPIVAAAEAPEDRQRRLTQIVSRIRRELGRTLSGARTSKPIEAVYVCGWELPDLVGTSLQDVPIYELDVFEEDSGQPVEGAAPLVVAYGVALRMLGGSVIQSRLRREELRYSGAFERVELPLAIGALLLVTLLAVFNIFELKQVRERVNDVDLWRISSNNFMLGDMRARPPIPGTLDPVPDEITKYFQRVRTESEVPGQTHNPETDPDRTRLEQMQYVSNVLSREVLKLDRELGNTGEITQPQSALEGITLVLATINELGEDQGRTAIRKASSQYMFGRSGAGDTVQVVLDLTFFADDPVEATSNSERLTSLLKDKKWCVNVESRGSKEFSEGEMVGVYIDGYTVTCDLSKLDSKQGTP
jgi:Tfp pilus assembly PilM family ATPase